LVDDHVHADLRDLDASHGPDRAAPVAGDRQLAGEGGVQSERQLRSEVRLEVVLACFGDRRGSDELVQNEEQDRQPEEDEDVPGRAEGFHALTGRS
jgi:hypothetical protein